MTLGPPTRLPSLAQLWPWTCLSSAVGQKCQGALAPNFPDKSALLRTRGGQSRSGHWRRSKGEAARLGLRTLGEVFSLLCGEYLEASRASSQGLDLHDLSSVIFFHLPNDPAGGDYFTSYRSKFCRSKLPKATCPGSRPAWIQTNTDALLGSTLLPSRSVLKSSSIWKALEISSLLSFFLKPIHKHLSLTQNSLRCQDIRQLDKTIRFWEKTTGEHSITRVEILFWSLPDAQGLGQCLVRADTE